MIEAKPDGRALTKRPATSREKLDRRFAGLMMPRRPALASFWSRSNSPLDNGFCQKLVTMSEDRTEAEESHQCAYYAGRYTRTH